MKQCELTKKWGEPSFLNNNKKKRFLKKKEKNWWQFNNCWGSSLSCAVVFKIVISQDCLLINYCYYGN